MDLTRRRFKTFSVVHMWPPSVHAYEIEHRGGTACPGKLFNLERTEDFIKELNSSFRIRTLTTIRSRPYDSRMEIYQLELDHGRKVSALDVEEGVQGQGNPFQLFLQ